MDDVLKMYYYDNIMIIIIDHFNEKKHTTNVINNVCKENLIIESQIGLLFYNES